MGASDEDRPELFHEPFGGWVDEPPTERAPSLTDSADPGVRQAALQLRQAQVHAAYSAQAWAAVVAGWEENLAENLRRVEQERGDVG